MTRNRYSDDQIIEMIRSGDRAEERNAVVYLQYLAKQKVKQHLYNRGIDRLIDLDEVSNEGAMAIVQKIRDQSFDSKKGSVEDLLNSILKNKSYNAFRAKNRKDKLGEEYRNYLDRLDPLKQVDEKLEQKEMLEILVKMIQSMDPSCRELLIAFWLENKSLKALSETNNQDYNLIKKRQQRCFHRLREQFKQYFLK